MRTRRFSLIISAALIALLAGFKPATADDMKAPAEFDVQFKTSAGDFTVHVTRSWAPRGADRFYTAVKAGFYDKCRFFRVVPKFVVQFGINGDPDVQKKWRTNTIKDDPVKVSNKKGYLTFATAGKDTRTTQLFINLKDNTFLDKMGFSPFVSGMENVDEIHTGYGEGAPRGAGPNQGRIQMDGNKYLKENFPKLDYIKSATVVTKKKQS